MITRWLVLTLCALAAAPARAEQITLFTSSFAPGDQGAIHAFAFDTETGSWLRFIVTATSRIRFSLLSRPTRSFCTRFTLRHSEERSRSRSPPIS